MNIFRDLYETIKRYDVITIWGHAMPDGDCYGSQVGLRQLIKTTFPSKRVFAVGSGMPSFYSRLGEMDHPSDEEISQSLGILVDVSCLRRVEVDKVYLCKEHIKFDHHRPNVDHEPFTGLAAVDHERIAAGEIIADFAIEMGMKFDQISAEALYLGMATDSGKFIYHGTTDHTFQLIAYLHSFGADFKTVLDIAYYVRKEVRQFKAFLKRHTHCSGQVDYAVCHLSDYERYGVTYEEGSSLVNCIAGRHKKPIYMLVAEAPDGTYRVELRSNKFYPVHQVAASFGGGGHRFAAGCTIVNGVPSVDEIIESLNQVKPVAN